MHQLPTKLRENVRLLGELLGKVIAAHEGDKLFQSVEAIRNISKSLAHSEDADYQLLIDSLTNLGEDEILPLARAFNQFLNLTNIADSQYYSSADVQPHDSLRATLEELEQSTDKAHIFEAIKKLNINLVLTAHPTEVSRRTLIRKYNQLIDTLGDLSRSDLLNYEKDKLNGRLYRLVEEIWTTDEIRIQRPTAVDEARGGYSVIEGSLWEAVPDFIRHLDRICNDKLGAPLPLDAKPFTFNSWMGGDRDGNPNVTHDVTERVILIGRARAARFYQTDIDELSADLSMHHASPSFLAALDNPDSVTPYRDALHALKDQLIRTRNWAKAKIDGEDVTTPADLIVHKEQILEPLMAIHQSLIDSGCAHIANGPLINTIRRVHAFGISLSPLDVRQDSDRHVQVFDELTQHLGLGSYREWDEERRQAFLLEQLQNKRPLIPRSWPASEDTQEVLDTCAIIADYSKRLTT